MSVEVVQYSMSVPKESKEVVDAVSAIVEHFKAGKSVVEAAALLPAVMVAVDGVQKLGEEAKSAYNDEAAAYCVHKVFGALKGPEVVQP
jgi:hypothetical protein